jgi:hypothetical protein
MQFASTDCAGRSDMHVYIIYQNTIVTHEQKSLKKQNKINQQEFFFQIISKKKRGKKGGKKLFKFASFFQSCILKLHHPVYYLVQCY